MPVREESRPPPLAKGGPKGKAPPPLKRVRSDARGDGRDDASDEAMRRRVEDELSKPTLAAPADDSDDATKGEWLFKQNEMVLGPVTAIVLVERIKIGELSADTPIARDGQPFKPMKLVPLFREAHEAMLAQKKREEEERQYNAAVARSRNVRVLVFAALILLPAGGGAFAGRAVMILQPWDHTAEWIAKAPPIVDLPPPPPEIKRVTPPPPPERVAERDDEEDRPEATGNGGGEHHVKLARADRAHERKGEKERPGEARDEKLKDASETKDAKPEKEQGFVRELTNEQAIAPLKDPSVKGALGACFRTEIESNPDMPTPLNLAYTITEEGRSANVELTNRELRGRPVQECVKRAW